MTATPGASFLIDPVPDDVFTPEDFSDEQRAMARTAEEFIDREVVPRVAEIEEKQEGVVPSLLRRAGELGLLAIEVPEAHSGLGLDKATALLVSERAAKVASFSVSWGAHTGIGTLPIGDGPLAADVAAAERAKKLVAWTAELLVRRNLKDLATRQQHLEILANMVIDTFAIDSVVARTRKLLRRHGAGGVPNELDITRIFVASANERITDGARRLVANELAAEELDGAVRAIERLALVLPIATIAAKTRVAERIVAGDARFLAE
jgi:alkylation response protein AidB-like acyl-CoA dehydrogenase